MSSKRQSAVRVASLRDSEPAAPRGSWMPIAFSVIAGLVVIGLLGSIMLTPQKAGTPANSDPAPANPPVSNQGAVEALRVGALAPDFTLPGMNGGQIQLSSFRGSKAVWVNFWATWCTFCKQEMPEMLALHNDATNQNVEFLGVDDHETKDEVQQYVQHGGYTWDFVLDESGAVDAQYRITGLPTHIFVGKDGIIKDIIVGGIQQDRMVSELKTLLSP